MVIKLAVRYRKYFPQCKLISCNGRQNKRYCPGDRPKRSNGEFKDCGVWCLEFFDDRKEWQSLTFKDVRCKTEAEKRLTLFISDRERGKLNLPKKKVVPTLAEYSQKYLVLYRGAKEGTLDTKRTMIKALVRYLGDYPLDKINSFIVEKFRVDRKEKDKVGDSCINDNITVLSHVFNTAIKEDIVDRNPCREVRKLKVTKTRDRVLSSDEIALLLDKLQGKDRLMTLLGLFTGMRLNEVLRLQWSDIELDKGLIVFVQSKTCKTLTIPISDYLSNELTWYRELNPGNNLFEDRKITKRIVNVYSQHFSAMFKQLGFYDFTFHNLRHTFSSLLQSELGVGAVVVQGMTGHSSLSMLQRYSHTGLDSKRKAIETLTSHVLNAGKRSSLPLVSKTGTA